MRAVLLFAMVLFLYLPGCATLSSVRAHLIGQPHIVRTIRYNVSDFTTEQADKIALDAREWETKTNHIVSFVVAPYVGTLEADEHSIVIVNARRNTETIRNEEIRQHKEDLRSFTLLGICVRKSGLPTVIYLEQERLTDPEMFREVVLHEIGHALLLKHSASTNSVMYEFSNLGASHITVLDQVAFCNIWHCDPILLSQGD